MGIVPSQGQCLHEPGICGLEDGKSLGNVGRQLGDDGCAVNETYSLDVTARYPSKCRQAFNNQHRRAKEHIECVLQSLNVIDSSIQLKVRSLRQLKIEFVHEVWLCSAMTIPL